jgi:hypothetical protein
MLPQPGVRDVCFALAYTGLWYINGGCAKLETDSTKVSQMQVCSLAPREEPS